MDISDEAVDGRGGSAGTRVLFIFLVVAGLLVGSGATYAVLSRAGSPAAADECGVRQPVDLAVAPQMYGVVVSALEEVVPACTRVVPTMRTGTEVARGVSMGGELPDVWIPEAHFLTTEPYVGSAAGLRLLARSVATTPVLLVGGGTARRFDSWGAAEASGLVTVPDPETSAIGALASIAPQAEARLVGRSPGDSRQLIVPFAQKQGARLARGADVEVRPEMFARHSPRLVVTTEQVLATAVTRPDLRDLTPQVGAPFLDFPVALRVGADPGSRAIARGVIDFLAGEEGRELLEVRGLRAVGAESSPSSASGVTTALRTPPATVLATAVQSWRTFAVPSAMLAVVDASGSMDIDAGGRTRMDLLAEAAGIGLSFLPDHARVGLWVFSIDKGGPGKDWRELEPVRRLDDLRFGRTQRFALRRRAEELPQLTSGGTGLYDTALAAYAKAVRTYRPHYSNAVVLMTDGRNEDPGSIGIEELLARLAELRDPERPVRLVGIAISGDADLGALRRMAHATGGEAYLAAEPRDVLEVFAQAVLSR